MAHPARHEAEKAEDATKNVNKAAEPLRNGTGQIVELTRDVLKAGAQGATTFGNDLQEGVGAANEMQRKSADAAVEFSKLYMDLFKEQAEHSLQAATAFRKSFNWDEAIRVQSDFLRASLERMSQLNSRYLEIVQAVMGTAVSVAKDPAKKAA